jgi:peptidoglycan-associated lipoprotein
MKRNLGYFLKLVAIVLSTLSFLGCASTVPLDDLPAVDSRSNTLGNGGIMGSAGNGSAANGLSATTGGIEANDMSDPLGQAVTTVQAPTYDSAQPSDAALAQRSVYFDYDSFVIRENFKAVLTAHAKQLTAHRNQSIALEGHTDDRGGREYNLALGQKRASAVQQAVRLLGVSDNQVEAVSFGKEKPKALGSTESDYVENRRVDIHYK